MMNKFKIGDRVWPTMPSYSEAEPNTGTVIDISDIASCPWPVAVRMDRNSNVGLYAYDELEHVEGDVVKESLFVTRLEEKGAIFEQAIRRAAKGVSTDTGDMMSEFSVGDRVRGPMPGYSATGYGNGIIIDISSIDGNPWPVVVAMDNGAEYRYAYYELEHVEESEHIDSLDEYQRRTQDTAVYPGQGAFSGATYAAMALNEEAGEVAGKVAKFIRKSSGWNELLNYGIGSDPYNEHYPEELLLAVSKELGDVLYQAARVAEEFGLNLSDIATENIERLADRKKRDVIIGEGDNR